MRHFYKSIIHLTIKNPSSIFTLYNISSKNYFLKKRVHKIPDNKVPFPITITIRSTNRCNLRCVQCGQWGKEGIYKNSFIKEELTTEQFKLFLKEISYFKPYVFFAGGEPFLRKDLIELVSFATSLGMLTGVSSNCTLLSEEIAEKLIKAGLTYFYASIDGPKEINDKIRVGWESFKKAVSGIKSLIEVRKKLKAKLPIIQIDTVITYENQNYLLEMAKLANDLEVDSFGLILEIFTTKTLYEETNKFYKEKLGIEAKSWKGFIREHYNKMDIKNIENQISIIKKSKWHFKFRPYPPIGKKYFNLNIYYNNPQLPLYNNSFCYLPWFFSQLMPNGDISSCSNHPDYIVGNIKEKSFQEIWNGEKYANFRRIIKENLFPSCYRCFGLYHFL